MHVVDGDNIITVIIINPSKLIAFAILYVESEVETHSCRK